MARVTFHGGPVIKNLEAVTIFLGSTYGAPGVGDWGSDPLLRTQATWINDMVYDLTDSRYFDQLREYLGGSWTDVRGRLAASARIPFAPGATYGNTKASALPDEQIRALLTAAIRGNVVPGWSPNRGYFVFVPPDVGVVAEDIFFSTVSLLLGYHTWFPLDGNQVPYAVLIHPGPTPIFPTDRPSAFQQLTLELTHEMMELVTDPIPFQGWAGPEHVELNDVCERERPPADFFHGYFVAKIWSERQQACLVPGDDNQRKPARAVRIQPPRTPHACGATGPLAGEQITFTATTIGIPDGVGPLRYRWTQTGATPLDDGQGATFTLRMPSAPGARVHVALTVTDVLGWDVGDELRLAVPAPLQSDVIRLLCELRTEAQINLFFDPLLDPARDLATTPISRRDLGRLQAATQRLAELAGRLHSLFREE